MFRWLRKLIGRRDALGYTAGEREIFEYWDGKRVRLGDPLAIHRTLMTMPAEEFDIKHDPGLTSVPTVAGLRATGRLAAAVRKAFGIETLDGGGLTDGECLRLFCEFGAVIRDLTESARPLASSPQPTAAAAESSPTATTAASSSTPGGSPVAGPAAT